MKTQIQLGVFVGMLALSGCDESIACPDIYLPRVRGTVVDEHGAGLLPDRVSLVGKETQECEIYPRGLQHDGEPSFQCFGAGNHLIIYRGDEVMEVPVPETQDPCGSDYPVLEITWKPE